MLARRGVTHLRYRLARWLLGYRPMEVPAEDGAYIFTIDRSGAYESRILIKTATLDLELSNDLVWRRFEDLDEIPRYRAAHRSGRFSGTIGDPA